MEISIEGIKKDTYEKAEKCFRYIQNLNVANFILNIISLLLISFIAVESVNYWITIIYVGLLILIYVLIFILDKQYAKYREIAEELRIIQFNKANLHVEITPEKKSYLLSSILPSKTYLNDIEIDYNANYFENQNLKFSLLQNIFFTQRGFKYHADLYLAIMLKYLVITIIITISFAIYSNFTENRTLIFQFILFFLNLITTTRYFLIYYSFRNKSDAFKELDAELVKTNSANENKTIALLIEYNSLLVDSYPTSTPLYDKHNSLLNMAWNERISSYDKAKLLSDFKENIENDIELLLLSLKKYTYKGNEIIGSFLDNSFVNGKSDLDILLVFETSNEIIQKEFYDEVYNVLKIKFGNNILQSLPAFVVKSFSDITIEFTPCIQYEDNKYRIVNSDYQFDEICPRKYYDHFKECNKSSNGLFYSLSKSVIECKYREDFSISSTYLKILLSNFILMPDSEKTLLVFLQELVNTQLKDIQNPVEPGNIITACNESEKVKLINKIQKFITACNESEKVKLINKIKKFIKDTKNGKQRAT